MCTFVHPEIGVRAHIITKARALLGKARYCFWSEKCKPPYTVNCVMLVRCTLDEVGVWEGDEQGAPPANNKLLQNLQRRGKLVAKPQPGDLIFVGHKTDHEHVGIITSEETVIHACWRRETVVEDELRCFWKSSNTIPYCMSLLTERVPCLTHDDVVRYVRQIRGKLPPQERLSDEAVEMTRKHAEQDCIYCEAVIERMRRYAAR